MYASAARTFTPLLTSQLFGFNFVIHFTLRMSYTRRMLLPDIHFDSLLHYYRGSTEERRLVKIERRKNASRCFEMN